MIVQSQPGKMKTVSTPNKTSIFGQYSSQCRMLRKLWTTNFKIFITASLHAFAIPHALHELFFDEADFPVLVIQFQIG